MSKDTTPRPHADRAEAMLASLEPGHTVEQAQVLIGAARVQALLDIGDAVERAAEQISQRLAISATDANRAIRELMAAWQEKP